MDALEKKGLVVAGSRRAFARNVLTVIKPADSTVDIAKPADLLDRDAQRGEVAVRAAVLLRRRQAEQPEVTHLLDHVDREVVVAVPLRDVRRDLLLGEVADRPAELLVFRRELERHDRMLARLVSDC